MFKVLRRTFEDNSEVFKNMFLIPQGAGNTQTEGGDSEHPIQLDGIIEDEMVQLLRVLYPKCVSR